MLCLTKYSFSTCRSLLRSTNNVAQFRALSTLHSARLIHSSVNNNNNNNNGKTPTYNDVYNEFSSDPFRFFGQLAQLIHWDKYPTKVYEQYVPITHESTHSSSNSNSMSSKSSHSLESHYNWYPDGFLNTCYNAVDIHVKNGHGSDVAVIHDSPVTNSIQKLTYNELLEKVSVFAGVLVNHGVKTGDRVLIYMPMVPEAIVAMLACARLGAVHSVVFGGFAAKELSVRIDDCKPTAIVSSSCGIEGKKVLPYKPLLDAAIKQSAHQPKSCIILQRPMLKADLIPGRDFDWTEEVKKAKPQKCVSVPSNHPLYILYTSGTTGAPKGILRENGPHAVALKWSIRNIFDLKPKETMFAASDVGWVVGHSYTCYGPLLNGSSTVCFEGKPVGTPDPGVYFRIIQEHQVNVMFTAPTALRAIKKEDHNGTFALRYNLSSLKTLFVAGEHCDTDTLHWSREIFKVPVIDHWWQTETGWPITAICTGIERLPTKDGSAGKAVPGYNLAVLNENGDKLGIGQLGEIAAKLPLPPGVATTLYNNKRGYYTAYLNRFPGYYHSGDAGYIDEDGYLFVMARTDDVINVAGHRLSTSALEDVLASHPAIAECAVVGLKDKMKGQIPIGLVVLKQGSLSDEQQATTQKVKAALSEEIATMVRDQVGAFACYKKTFIVDKLPKSRSGKILRKTLRQMANHETVFVPATIEDESVLEFIKDLLDKEKHH